MTDADKKPAVVGQVERPVRPEPEPAEMDMQKNCVPPCNGCPTPGNCINTDGCEAAALAVPTYYVRHPDGTYSAANPQPRYVGPHTPRDAAPTMGIAKVADRVRRSRVKLQPSPMSGRA
jgi:hypothetical protein